MARTNKEYILLAQETTIRFRFGSSNPTKLFSFLAFQSNRLIMDDRLVLCPDKVLRKVAPFLIQNSQQLAGNSIAYDYPPEPSTYPLEPSYQFADYGQDGPTIDQQQGQHHIVFTIKMSNKSLVKYNLPKCVPGQGSNNNSLQSNAASVKHSDSTKGSSKTASGPTAECRIRKSNFLPSIDGSNASVNEDVQDILNTVVSPKRWREADSGEEWVQEAATTPATRIDVFNLQRHLDDELEARNAKEFGLCPVRRQLYNQAFDELIRQVTVNCSERGLMLGRIRDEIRLTLSTYQCLYESAVGYGLRKAIVAEQVQADTDANLADMNKQHADYNMKIDELKDKLVEEGRMHTEEKTLVENKLTDENHKLAETNTKLKEMIEKLLGLDNEDDFSWMNLDNYIRNFVIYVHTYMYSVECGLLLHICAVCT